MTEDATVAGTVMIVDDDPSNLKVLDGVLGGEYATVLADSGPKALEMLGQQQVDLILLDLLMPEMDGIAVCREIKQHPEWQRIPVMFITGMNDPINESVGLRAGAVDYITKPIRPQIVKARVRLHLQNALHIQFLERLLDETTSSLEKARQEARELLDLTEVPADV